MSTSEAGGKAMIRAAGRRGSWQKQQDMPRLQWARAVCGRSAQYLDDRLLETSSSEKSSATDLGQPYDRRVVLQWHSSLMRLQGSWKR